MGREDNLGDIPLKLALEARRILREDCLPVLYESVPWLEEKLNWDEEEPNFRSDTVDTL